MKYVVVQGLPPTGCLPLAMSLAREDDRDNMRCVKSVKNQSSTDNAVYLAKLQDLRRKFTMLQFLILITGVPTARL